MNCPSPSLGGVALPKHLANLDALIIREDFEGQSEEPPAPSKASGSLQLNQLEPGNIILTMLRKPDFQRETANWSPEKVAELVRAFVDGDLIPSIIMWRSPLTGNIFVIDGAHRLSALIAWVHDDYGDRQISTRFFGNTIAPEQELSASTTRDFIKNSIGSYEQLKYLVQHQESATEQQIRRAKNAGILPIELQWVTGDASKAEASFFAINQSATAIDPTELRIIKARRKPNAVAARAIIRAGTGHKYWAGFSPENQTELERLSREIYNILFDPALETPIKTLDLPVAGRGYSADSLSLVFDFINFVNDFRPESWSDEVKGRKRKTIDPEKVLKDDADGASTIIALKAVKRSAARISGNLPQSLGLHPAVYFYGATGRYQPTAFLATVALVQELDEKNGFFEFTTARYRFEEFLLKYRYFVNQIVGTYGSGTRSLDAVLDMYRLVLKGIKTDLSDDNIVKVLQIAPRLTRSIRVTTDADRESRKNFSTETKSAAFLREAIEGAVRCAVCKARIHLKGITVDHKMPKRDGGLGDIENAQITHPYCNSGYKESEGR